MKKKVLIVDDETDARLLLRQYILPHENLEIIGEADNLKVLMRQNVLAQ